MIHYTHKISVPVTLYIFNRMESVSNVVQVSGCPKVSRVV